MRSLCIYFLVFIQTACSQSAEPPKTGHSVVPADSVITQKAFTPEPLKLLGTWKADVPPIEDQPATQWEIKFIDNGQYTSFYKPSNRKHGTWRLRGDTLSLYVKAVDDFRVLELNDSVLKIKVLDQRAYEYSFRKKYSE